MTALPISIPNISPAIEGSKKKINNFLIYDKPQNKQLPLNKSDISSPPSLEANQQWTTRDAIIYPN